MRVLVTGGCGFVGAAFVRRARAQGHDVVTFDRAPQADAVGDVADASAVTAAMMRAQPEAIVHLAAALTDAGERDPVDAVRANALGTTAVFAAAEAAHVQRVVLASSNAAVGPCAPGTLDDAPLRPQTVYGVTKAFGEQLAYAMSRRRGAPACLALRFGWMYGAGRARGWAAPQQVIIDAIARREPVRYPDYAEPIDWTYVDDAADVLTRALACPLDGFAVHNAVGDHRLVRDAVNHLRARLPGLVAEPYAAALPPSAWGLVNDGLARRIGAWAPTRLEDGIDRMITAIHSSHTVSS